jgi:glycosyltransferase EpsF
LRINGISTFILNLGEGLDKDQFEISVVNTAADDGYYKQNIESFGGKTYNIFTKGTGISRALIQAKKLKKILVENGPFDAVHSHYFSNNGLYLKIAFEAKVPIRISHCHQSNPQLTLTKKIAVTISRLLIKRYATHKVGCSNQACAFLYGKMPSKIIYYGIDYTKFNKDTIDPEDIFQKFGLCKDKKYILNIGRFAVQKNHAFLLDVYNRLAILNPSLDLILVGHGPLEKTIKTHIDDLGLTKRVHFLNPDMNVAGAYRIAECFLFPSLWEGWGIVLIESQAMGVRCFISDVIQKEVDLGLCTFLPLDPAIWEEKIQTYLSQNHTEQAIQPKIFGLEKMVDDIRKIYSQRLAEQYCDAAKELSLGSVNYKADRAKSVEFYKKAHDLGNSRGTFGYALAFFEGNSVTRDRPKAQQLVALIIEDVREKAKMGDPKYQVVYGDMFSFGLGQVQNFEEAFSWYSKAAKKNNLESLCDLGYCYLVGQGVEKNLRLSSKYWLKSAKLGYAHSCRDIGLNYLKGIGVKKNAKKAVYWFKKAEEYNYSYGSSDLAEFYLYGAGVPVDLGMVKTLYHKALELDYDRAFRAILAARINVTRFLDDDIIEIDTSESIIMNKNERIYKGTLFVNSYIKVVEPRSFYDSDKLEKILVDTDNPYYASVDGVLFTKDRTRLLKYPIGRKTDTYQIPNIVTEIGEHAFQNARQLKKVLFNQYIRIIGTSAFDDCKNLESIDFNPDLREIGDWAFHGCDKIPRIRITRGIEKIGKCAFGSCENLIHISVEQSSTYFSEIDGNLYTKDGKVLVQYAIAKKDQTFTLPDSVETISYRSISDAFHLEKALLPKVKVIQEKAFYYDIKLKEVRFTSAPIFEGKEIFGHTHEDLKLILNDTHILEYKNDSPDS